MSWYSEKNQNLLTPTAVKQLSPSKPQTNNIIQTVILPPQSKLAQNPLMSANYVSNKPLLSSSTQNVLTMVFTVTDMYNQDDYHLIKEHLLNLKGVVEVKSFYSPKKLYVSFNTALTSVEVIVFTIAKLGYHYINRG